MTLCRHCGVEVESDRRSCPLCRRTLQPGAEATPQEVEPPPQPRGDPPEVKRRLNHWLLEVFTLLALTAAIVVAAADFSSGMSLDWALYPLAAIACVWLMTLLLILGGGRWPVVLPGGVVIVSLFLMALESLIPGRAWFVPLALPLTLLLGVVLGLTLVIIRFLRLSPFTQVAVGLLAGGVACVGVELLLNRYLAGVWSISWSAVPLACALPLALILIYLRKRLRSRRAEIRKVLHL